jgi:membrane protein
MKKKIYGIWRYLKQVFSEFAEDNILKFSASLAYYTIFSLAPMLMVIISLSGLLFGQEAMQGHIYSQIKNMVGADAALQIQDIIKNIHVSGKSFFASVVSVIILLVGATSIFGEIQDSLNKIWGLKIKTKKTWWKLILNRILSFSLIVSIGFIMMVSLLLNALISAFGNYIGKYLNNFSVVFIEATNNILTLFATTFLFALMFKILPDAKIKWRDVIFGGLITSFFFTLGKWGIGYYLGQSNLATVYGAAGSVIIILVWVYYSAVILYLGAEFTKVYAKMHGGKIYPNEYAVWIKTEEIQVSNAALKNKVLN